VTRGKGREGREGEARKGREGKGKGEWDAGPAGARGPARRA